jgi:hypothetical protein
MASGYHGSGYAPLQISSLLKPKPVVDPNWELNAVSEETTSIFQESVPYRTLSAVGFLKPILLKGSVPAAGGGKASDPDPVTQVESWASIDQNTNTFELKFYFEDVEIQNCTAIEVESILMAGFPVVIGQTLRRSESDLCGSSIDPVLASDVINYNFSGKRGTVRFREANNIAVVHEIEIFASHGGENGWYTLEEILDRIKTKVKAYIDARYSPNSIEVEIFISTTGRLVIAWSGAAIKAATGGLLIDTNPFTSPIIGTILNYFHYEGFKKDHYTYGTVSSGDGISFVRSGSGSGGELGALPVRNMSNISSFAVAISPELSQFERDDSITPIAATGEIASFFPTQLPFSEGRKTNTVEGFSIMEHLYASKANGNLSSPKIPFDKNYTLNSFTVSVVGPDKAGYLQEFINYLTLLIKDKGVNQIQERAIHCILTAKLF